MLRIVTAKGKKGELLIGQFEDTPTKQQLKNFYRARRYFDAKGNGPDSEVLSQATALAVDYKSLEKYCRENGIA